MDGNQKAQQLSDVAYKVTDLLDELMSREGKHKSERLPAKRVAEIKVAIVMYLRIAYQLGSEHVMQDVIDGTMMGGMGSGNGHNGHEK